MPLFRFHRGSLEDSLSTTVIVKSIDELKNVIICSFNGFTDIEYFYRNNDMEIKIKPYQFENNNNFDKRTGWYMQIVTIKSFYDDEGHVVSGFLSEPFQFERKLDKPHDL